MNTGGALNARMMILSAAVLWSLGGVGIKYCQFGAWQLAGLRSGIAGLALLCFLPASRQRPSIRTLGVGLSLALTMVLFVWANKMTTAANTIFLQGSYPLWILLLSPFLLGEAVRRRDAMMTAVFAAGLTLCFLSPEQATALSPNIQLGNILAVTSGMFFAFTIMGFRALRRNGVEGAAVQGNFIGFALCLPMMIFSDGALKFTMGEPGDWVVLALLGVFQVGLAYVAFVRGIKKMRAMEASLIGVIEPVLNPIWVFLVFRQERPGLLAVAGGCLIVVATVFQIIRGNSKRRAEPGGGGIESDAAAVADD